MITINIEKLIKASVHISYRPPWDITQDPRYAWSLGQITGPDFLSRKDAIADLIEFLNSDENMNAIANKDKK